MYQLLDHAASALALALECIAVLLIGVGSMQALVVLARSFPTFRNVNLRNVFRALARWLLLALEFTLAADVVHTAISPSWNDIGQLAAITLIRTFLNYFLERDLEKARAESEGEAAAGQATP
jgi:uncharacterized membrane protein